MDYRFDAALTMRKLSRRSLLVSLGAIVPFAYDAIAGSPGIAQFGVLNVYTARNFDTDTLLYLSFTQKTGIPINLVEDTADKLIERIKNEGLNSPADAFLTVDAGSLWRAKEAGILQAVKTKALESSIPTHLRDPDGFWFGLSKQARIIIYNKSKVKPSEITTYEDLANPKWKGRVVVRSSTYVHNQSLVSWFLATHGEAKTEAWVRGLVANFARPPEGNDTSQIRAVAAGTADLALVNTYFLLRLAKSKRSEEKAIADKVGIIFPNQGDRGTYINISGGGVVKTSKNRPAAIAFLEHLAGKDSQELFASANNEYPVLTGIKVDPVLGVYSSFKEDRKSATLLAKNNAEVLKIMESAGWK